MENPVDLKKSKDLEVRADFTRNMFKSCIKLCVKGNETQEIGTNEKVCLDRCAAKYLFVGDYVGKIYQRENKKK